MDIFKASI